VGTIREAEELPASLPVEVVLVGVDVLDMDGVEGIDRLLTRFARARVVMLGTTESSTVIIAALRRGADGYLPRDLSAEGLVRALQGVAHGEVAVPRALLGVVVSALRVGTATGAAEDLLLHLSSREQDVLTEMVRGRTNAEIAQRLGLKESTVKTHVSSILRKTGARSRFALQMGASAGRASA
jgi:DNA-binding NarL/FixJ family response regulator